MFKYFDEFYKASFYHFIVSAAGAALFALGLEYSRGEDGDDVIDYYIPAIVLSAIQFLLSIVCLLLFALTRGCAIAVKSYGSRSRKSYHRLKAVHVLLSITSFIWGIVGAILTATSGVCKKKDKCSYAGNTKINRTLAIIIIVLHMLNVAVSYIFLSTSRSQTRTTPLSVTKTTSSKVKENETITLKLARAEDADQTKNKKSEQLVLEPRKLKRSMSNLSRDKRQTGKYYDDSLLGREIKSSLRVKDIVSDSPKPLPKKKTKLMFPAVGKVIFQYNSVRNKAVNNQELRIPSASPPSYDDATTGNVNTNPYWLPPLPTDHREMHRLPDNMYVGNAYPETEIVAVHPHDVSRR